MPDDSKRKAARREVRAAQKQFARDSEATREARRRAFAKAQAAGLSLREIAEETGLHHSTVAEIARGK
jgi:DNA-directed RNA polymerase specialized sigma24 family protein